MLREFLSELEYPWLLALAGLVALFSLPALVRFFYGNTFREVTRELGVDEPLTRQITILQLLLYRRWFSLRAVAFVGSYLVVAGAVYLVLAGIARTIS